MARVVCAGHVNWDVTLRVDRLPDRDGEASIQSRDGSCGGSATNAAVVLSGLDVEAHLLGSVGTDDRGRTIRRELGAAGVESHLVAVDGETSRKYVAVGADGEVMVFGSTGVNEAFAADDLPDAVRRDADVLHLTNQDPATASTLAARAAAADVPVSFDPGRRFADRDFSETIATTDLLFVNDRNDDPRDGTDDVPVVVRKRGSDGALVHAGGETIEHAGFEADPVDTTGAGDAFDAGFLAARLRGDDLETALSVANACGALATRATGAHVQVEWADVETVREADRVG